MGRVQEGMKRFGWLLGLAALGCAGNAVTRGDVAQDYIVEYDATQNLTLVSAQFNQSGRSVQLFSPSTVTAGGTALTFNALNYNSYPYTASLSGYVGVPIIFTDGDGRQYANTIAANQLLSIGFPADFTGFPNTGTVVLNWVGAPLSTGQTVTLRVTGDLNTVREYSTSTLGATSLTFNAGEIFGISNARAALIRSASSALTQVGPAGGNLAVRYSTGYRTLTIQ